MIRVFKIIALFVIISSCTKDDVEDNGNVVGKDPLTAARIAWDYSSLQKLVPLSGNSVDYSSYPRMIELDNGDFICVYEANGNIDMIRSSDKAQSWMQPVRISTFKNNTSMTVPEVIQIKNGDIIISYNPRPNRPFTEDRRFSVVTKTSTDNGATWGNENVVYKAGTSFETGCWEPQILELPNGELQLYFANEGDFSHSHEQNISMLRSSDNGRTWGDREIVSFSPTSRDGMPVALYLEQTDETIMVIEDNYANNFKPAIIRTSSDWKNAPVGRNTSDRFYALDHDQRSPAYQGAPYIRKMPSGNVVLSYQGTDGETNHDIHNSRMLVEVGDKEGRNFTGNTKPFNIPTGKFGLWNSLSVMDGKIWALTATNGYSNSKMETWTISGYEITDYKIPQGKIVASTSNYPFFVGHTGNTNVGVRLGQDDSNLYIKAEVKDESVIDSDEVTFCIDPKNVSPEAPENGIYQITINSNGDVSAKEGNNGKWEIVSLTPSEISVNKNADGYTVELSISWTSIGGKSSSESRIGFSIGLYNNGNGRSYQEELVLSDRNMPYTWASTKL